MNVWHRLPVSDIGIADLGTIAVHIHQPLVSLEHHDAVVLPKHEWPSLSLSSSIVKSEKVIPTERLLNDINADTLAEGKANAPALLPSLFLEEDASSPIVAVLIGGGIDKFRYESGWGAWQRRYSLIMFGTKETSSATLNIHTLKSQRLLEIHNARILMTFSQRTTEEIRTFILTWLKKLNPSLRERVYLWNEEGPNPYRSFLAIATHIAVMGDSLTMTSESLETRFEKLLWNTRKSSKEDS
ncbi:hypothetical protein HK104_004442 [Borealophlyctis nickersoniae]|nr:hypothetical protein HK104_004442 [Borealophlyctis nickersoniae]